MGFMPSDRTSFLRHLRASDANRRRLRTAGGVFLQRSAPNCQQSSIRDAGARGDIFVWIEQAARRDRRNGMLLVQIVECHSASARPRASVLARQEADDPLFGARKAAVTDLEWLLRTPISTRITTVSSTSG